MYLREDINTDAMNLCYDMDNSESHLHYLNVETVSCAISKMNAGKSDGYDGLTLDYLKNGSDLLYSCITLLFNCILCHVMHIYLLVFAYPCWFLYLKAN